MIEIPLILGGHSFIAQLGNDPLASEEEQLKIVESCLEHGVRWFDTTYQPERFALGRVLEQLDRRAEAKIFAWNFFKPFSPGDPVGEAEYYSAQHIEIILEQLRTPYVDGLVMVPLHDPEENQRQEELLVVWQKKGYVRSLGLWVSDPLLIEHYGAKNVFEFAVRPCNITTADVAPIFAACKKFGWNTFATSPFVRGWELERRTARAESQGYGDAESLQPIVADLMLRYSLFQSNVDRLIVAMRNVKWVSCNVASVCKGPLTADEHYWLEKSCPARPRKHLLWERLRRWFSRHQE